MWTSFLKAFLVLMLVMGIQEFWSAGYYAYKRRRIESLRWLWRGLSWIIVAVLAFWLIRLGRLQAWDSPETLILAFLPLLASYAIEIYITVRIEHRPWTSVFNNYAEPCPTQNSQSPIRKALMVGLGMSLMVTEFAIVSFFVAPELLGIGWWSVAIASAVMIGIFVGFYFLVINRVTPN
jgi:hypothetical protein